MEAAPSMPEMPYETCTTLVMRMLLLINCHSYEEEEAVRASVE